MDSWIGGPVVMFRFDGHKGPVRCVAYAPDGGQLASGGDDQTVRVWDRSGGEATRFAAHPGGVWAVAFRPDGSVLASGGAESSPEANIINKLWEGANVIRLWDLRDEEDHESFQGWIRDKWTGRSRPVVRWLADGRDPIHFLAFVGGDKLIVADRPGPRRRNESGTVPRTEGQVRCLRVRTDDPAPDVRPTWLDRRSNVAAVAVSADGTTAAVASRQYVRVGRLDADRVPPGYAAKADVASLALSPDGSELAGCWGNRVTVWTTAGGAEVREFDGHAGDVRAVTYRPDGSALASAGLDGTVLVWEPGSGAVRAVYDWGLGPVHALAFAPDGLTLAVAGERGLAVVDFE